MATQAPGGLDFEALRRAIEERDAETLLGFYADDAELRTVNRNTTPSSPRVLRGKEEISEYLRDVCSREMTHRVENEVAGGESYRVQRGVRVPGWDACPGRRDVRVARRQDRAPGDRGDLGRVVSLPKWGAGPGS